MTQLHTGYMVVNRGSDHLLTLGRRARDEELTTAEAMRQAERAGWSLSDANRGSLSDANRGSLSDDDLYGAVEDTWRAANSGDLRSAYTHSAVLFAAVRPLRSCRPQVWRTAARGFVRISTELLAEHPDAVVYHRARRVATDLVAAQRRPDDLLLAGKLRLEPYAADPIIGNYRARIGRWFARQPHPPGREPGEEMPDPVHPLSEAVALLAEAADGLTGRDRGFALAHQAYASFSLAEAGAQADHDDICAVCLRAWPLVEGEPLASARLCWILARYEQIDRIPSSHYAVYFDEIEHMVDRYGVRETVALGAVGVRVFGARDPALTRWLCPGLLAVVPADRLEDQRLWLATHRAHQLPHDPLDCAQAATQPIPTLLDAGRAAGWRAVQLADAALHILAHGDELGDSVEALIRVAALSTPGTPPDEQRQKLIELVVLRRLTLAAVARSQAGDHGLAASLALRAAAEHALLGYPASARICLDNALRSILRGSADDALLAAGELPQTADLLVSALGPAGADTLHHIYRHILHLGSDADPDAVLVLMQLAKGRAFARAQALGDPGSDAGFAAFTAALDAATDAEHNLDLSGAPTGDAESPDVSGAYHVSDVAGAYVGAYRGPPEVLDGSAPAVLLANLRRRCQLLDAQQLASREGPVPLFGTDELRTLLPERTVLVSFYGGPVGTPPSEGWHCHIGSSDGSAYLSVADPQRAGHFDPLLRSLATLHRQGKRHLVIWPHGTGHTFPFHLLPTGDGRLLVDDWTVTFTPSLIPLAGGARPAGGPASDATVLVDHEATRDGLFRGAQHARYLHLAAPERPCVPAPLFDRIVLSDGAVCAHDLLRRRFDGVELVTLNLVTGPTGPSTLLRYDVADNLHGIAAALLRGGAAAVVGTLWPVPPAVADYFFTTLYRLLATDDGKLAAFSGAQRATRAQYPQHRDWGAFCLVGDWR